MIIKLTQPVEKDSLDIVDDIRVVKFNGKSQIEYYCEPQVPDLPGWTDKIYNCKGHQVNLFKLTCTCESYKERKEKYGGRDVRLCCEHIYYKLTNQAVSKYISGLYLNLTYAAARLNVNSFYTFNIDGRDIYFGFKGGSAWVNVFVPVRDNDPDSYARFIYNIEKRRWAQWMEPGNAWKMVHIVDSIRKTLQI